MKDEKHQKKQKTRCCSVPWISCFDRRDETNGRMTPQALNKFLITVHKKGHNEEYESNSLGTFFASFQRHSKKIYYGLCLMKNVQFEQTRKALQSKQRDLKRKGMGNKPNASAALSEEDIQVLFEKDLLGSFTAEALLNTVWFNNIIHFGLLGCKEHREMCWGEVKLCQNFHRAGEPRIQ